jgi:hypothetical protein
MRHFHYTKNKYHAPAVNIERLWTLVSDQQRKIAAAKGKEAKTAPIIDVTKAVCALSFFHHPILHLSRAVSLKPRFFDLLGFLQGHWKGMAPKAARRRQG